MATVPAPRFTFVPTKDERLRNDVVALVNQLWSLPQTKSHMPCPNPSSLDRTNLSALSNNYVVSPKTDGIRMFLLIGAMESTEQTYSVFINRAYDIFPLSLSAKYNEVFDGTLLDGEITQEPSGNFLYTVFDAVAASGYDLKECSFNQRKNAVENALAGLCPASTSIRFVPKPWFPLSTAVQVFQDNRTLCDGLILQPVDGRLKAGIQSDVFKWKPVDRQTIDFYISQDGHGEVQLECGHGAEVINAREINCYFDVERPCLFVFSTKRRVYECFYTHFVEQRMFFGVLKERSDKQYANDARVVVSTLRSMQDNITVEELAQIK